LDNWHDFCCTYTYTSDVICLGCCMMWNRSNNHNANRKHTCNSDPLDLHNPMTACIGIGTTEAMPIIQPIKIG
jgi:hypothetical protein